MRGLWIGLTLVAACASPADAPVAPPDTVAAEMSSAAAPAGSDALGVDTTLDDAPDAEPLTPAQTVPMEAGPFDPRPSDPQPAEEPVDRRFAVLVGLNDYPGEDDDLPSGRADVRAMRDLLIGHFGYRSENVRTLTDRNATRSGLRRAVRDHLGQAGPDGSALLYVSGHGVRLEDNVGADAEADGRDEAVYLWADRGERGALVRDDEIGAWIGALGTDRALVILDACHSGTGSRLSDALALAPKEVAYDAIADRLDGAALGAEATAVPAMRHTHLAAARDAEVALSGWPGEPSLFTDALVDALRAAAPNTSLADVMRTVRRVVRAESRRYRSEHTPQIGGRPQTVADVFGRSGST